MPWDIIPLIKFCICHSDFILCFICKGIISHACCKIIIMKLLESTLFCLQLMDCSYVSSWQLLFGNYQTDEQAWVDTIKSVGNRATVRISTMDWLGQSGYTKQPVYWPSLSTAISEVIYDLFAYLSCLRIPIHIFGDSVINQVSISYGFYYEIWNLTLGRFYPSVGCILQAWKC